jgi:hypothetical protein
MFKKINLTFLVLRKGTLLLEKEVIVVGSMSIVAAGGFEYGLPRII